MTSSAADRSTAFGGHAALYARRRPGYPPSIYTALDAALAGPRDHAVDLGAGSGQATSEIAKRFQRVTAVEPDARMAGELPPIANVQIIKASAEASEFADGSIDAVIAATSFHWMDQKRVIANVYRWLRPGGVFFPFRYSAFEVEGPAKPVYERHARLWEPFKDRRLSANIEYMKPIVAAGLFSRVEIFRDEIGSCLSAGDAAGLFGTTSYGSAYAHATFGGVGAYISLLTDELGDCGEALKVKAPIIGVVAVKAA